LVHLIRTWLCCAVAALLLGAAPVAQASAPPQSFGPGPDQYPNVYRQTDVPIVMRDGTKLYADVYRPADASGNPVQGRFPVVLNQIVFNKNFASTGHNGARVGDGTPYSEIQEQANGYAPLFVTHGYVQVIVDVRGTGSSEGKWDMFGPASQRDTMDVARWLVRQPFSNGEFVGYGASCMAINQLFMAAQHPPGLKALFPIVPMDDLYRDVLWHGGGLDAPFLAVFHGLVTGSSLAPPAYVLTDPDEGVRVIDSHVIPGNNVPAGQILTDPYDSPYYQVRSPGRVVSQIDVPTFVVGGWFDLFQRGTPRVYNALRLPPDRKKLLIGPWYHANVGDGLGQPGAPPPLTVLALAWFDRWVKGKQNGIDRYAPVTVDQLGPEHWQSYGSYPRRDAGYQRFYLNGGKSGSAHSWNDGQLTTAPPRTPGADVLPANKASGACTRGVEQWSAGLVPPGEPCATDNRTQEATSLTYTTPALKQPLHLSGPLSLTLNGSTTANDTTWIATVSDVAPNGNSSELTAGWLIQSRRALDRARTTFAPNGDAIVPFHPFTAAGLMPVKPGERDSMNVEIFNTDAVLAPGHRLRVTISSGDVPHLFEPMPSLVTSLGAINTVYRAPASPSYLTATVAPLGSPPAQCWPRPRLRQADSPRSARRQPMLTPPPPPAPTPTPRRSAGTRAVHPRRPRPPSTCPTRSLSCPR